MGQVVTYFGNAFSFGSLTRSLGLLASQLLCGCVWVSVPKSPLMQSQSLDSRQLVGGGGGGLECGKWQLAGNIMWKVKIRGYKMVENGN